MYNSVQYQIIGLIVKLKFSFAIYGTCSKKISPIWFCIYSDKGLHVLHILL